jgi:uncharacterized membrane protein
VKQDREQRPQRTALEKGLGWFSIGLGVTQLVAPRRLSRLVGINEHPVLMRMLGVREIMSGVGILVDRRTPWLWSRVAGDAMDLALLGTAFASDDSEKTNLIAATSAVAAVTALDTFTSIRTTMNGRRQSVTSAITVTRPIAEAYDFWRDEQNFSRFIKSVPVPVEIVDARPTEFIEWRSRDGILVRSASVSFRPAVGRDGTEVYAVVDGRIPRALIHEDLRRFKRLLETGEIPTTEGQSAGPSATAVVARVVHRLEGKGVA